MAENLIIHTGSKEEKYRELLPQLHALVSTEADLIANLANMAAALKQTFGFFWVGFYLVKEEELVLGPFQGPIACTRIRFGRGVCGTAWKEARTLIVPDVEQFPGHIACSSDSKSEIVVPILKQGKVVGVLDIDSDTLDSFDTIDACRRGRTPLLQTSGITNTPLEMSGRRTAILFTVLSLLTAALFTADLLVGSVAVALRDIRAALTGGSCDPAVRDIILKIRLLKAVTALFVGAALAASGLQMQTLFRNPLAGPYVLGISSGAGLGVALFLLGAPLLGVSAHSFVQSLGIAGAAWLGAALVLLIVMAVSRRIKDIMVILILGMMFGSGVASVVEILQYLSDEAALKSFVVWTMGSLGDVTGSQLALLLPVVTAGLALAVAVIKPLNLLLLGENYARTMGLNVQRTRTLLFLSTVLLAGTVTAFCGPVGFIGLAVPHLARMLFASADHRVLMPASMLSGAALLLVCDLISKSLALPINTVTALMGIPVVIVVVVRNRNLF